MAEEKILVRGVNWLGDAVMTTPALRRLREARPRASITLLTPAKLADLWKHHPCLDDVIAITPEEGVMAVGKRLRWGNFTTGLILPNSPRTALELWFGKIPERIGYARPWRNLFLTRKISARSGEVKMRKRTPEEIRRVQAADQGGHSPEVLSLTQPDGSHHVHQYLHLVAQAFGANPAPLPPLLRVTDEEKAAFARHWQITVEGTLWLGLNPGAEYGPAKRWPAARFIAAAQAIQKQTGCRWFLFGGKADVALNEEIAAALGPSAVNLAGKTTLRELCVALQTCRVLLTNDTGPMHVAAALGTPLVALFGSTSPELTGPLAGGAGKQALLRARLDCSPCFLRECPAEFRCMAQLSPEWVAAQVLARLGPD